MSDSTRHLAELNLARLRYPIEVERVADFVNNLERVNAVAERSEGFVWRLKDESGNAIGIQAFDDPMLIVNMSVWESVEKLEQFVWQTVHKRIYGRKGEWFGPMGTPHFVMWWIPAGHIPTLVEARERLELLTAKGPSEDAFGWESVPAAQLWKTARCDHGNGSVAA
jgi:hypothetical protein